LQILSAVDKSQSVSFYDLTDELKPLVCDLLQNNPSRHPGPETFVLGQGEWKVFYAPHISRFSATLMARFDPIIYRLAGTSLVSSVRYSHPLLGSGWLSASGVRFVAPGMESFLFHQCTSASVCVLSFQPALVCGCRERALATPWTCLQECTKQNERQFRGQLLDILGQGMHTHPTFTSLTRLQDQWRR
jgi:hypothetical protein